MVLGSRKRELVAKFETRAILAVNGLYPHASEILRQRLSKSMALQYTRLLYWRHNDNELRADHRQTQPRDDRVRTNLKTQPVSADKPLQEQQGLMANQLKHDNAKVTGGTSWLSGKVPPNTGSQRVLPAATGLTPQSMRTTATSILESGAKFPPPPEIRDEEDQKPCPLCRVILSKVDVADVGQWRLVALPSWALWRGTCRRPMLTYLIQKACKRRPIPVCVPFEYVSGVHGFC